MKILIVNSVFGYGSTGRICTDAAKFFLKKGHEVKTAYGRAEAVFDKTVGMGYRIGSNFSVNFHGVLTRLFDLHGFGSKHATKKFVKWADNYAPDVVWIHNIHGYYLNFCIFFKWLYKKKIKVVWTLHDCWAFTGHCTHFSFIDCQKWKSCCDKCPQKMQYPKSYVSGAKRNYLIKKKVFSHGGNITIVTPSSWLNRAVRDSFLNVYPSVVINNGIDLDSFYFEESNLRNRFAIGKKKIILCISSIWNDRKGASDIFRLSKMLNDDEILFVVGQFRKPIAQWPKNIIAIKRTNNLEQLRQIYSSADVMFNPTYEDTYSNINMESLACGTPVVCYKTGGAWEMLEKEFVVPQGSVKDAIDVMRKIFAGDLKCRVVRTDFSYKKTIDEYEKLLTTKNSVSDEDNSCQSISCVRKIIK